MIKILMMILCLAGGVLGALKAAETATFPDFANAKHISGMKLDAKQVKGKVVLFVHWGIKCPMCKACFPELVKVNDEYSKKGLLMIGTHSQGDSPELPAFIKEHQLNFPIYQGIKIAEAPCPGGLPYAVLIGANGKIIAKGTPKELFEKIPAAVKDLKMFAGESIVGDLKLVKYKSLAKALTLPTKNVEAQITKLRDKQDDEARAICEKYDAWVEETQTALVKDLEKTPLTALAELKNFRAAVPSFEGFEEEVKAIQAAAGFAKLEAFNKKIDEMRAKAVKLAAAIPEKEIIALKKQLEKLAADNDEINKKIIAELTAKIERL